MLILTPDEIRKAEEGANKNGLSYEDMMESAGMGCGEHILKSYPHCKNAVILCGKGKNGGDGFVIARCLCEAGIKASVVLAFNSPSDSLSEKNKKRLYGTADIYDGTRLSETVKDLLKNADIIIDAVFGIGFKGSLPTHIKEIFSFIKACDGIKIAIDIPSGLSENNENNEDCFIADETLSMLCFKPEHIYKPYSDFCGRVSVIPIGFGVFGDFPCSFTTREIREKLPVRPYNSNKGTFGKALIIAGSYKMPGAGIICTKGCLSSGAGLTFFAFPDKIYPSVTSNLTECVLRPLSSDTEGSFSDRAYEEIKDELDSFSAIAIGPGIGTGETAEKLVFSLIKSYTGKLIVDADGINLISRNINILKESKADILLTPHPGEMSRLTGKSISQINSERIKTATEFATEYNVSLLLKGANTVISDKNGRIFINPTGSSALARGGSGDLLTGIALSFASQGKSLSEASVLAAYIHGLAGEISERKFTAYASSVERIYDCIPRALSKIISGK